MTKPLIGYLALCIVAVGGALLMLLALGAFGEYGMGLFGKIAIGLSIILVVIGGMVLVVLSSARGPHDDAVARKRDSREALSGRPDEPSE
jgi:uncharacterized membrane protein